MPDKIDDDDDDRRKEDESFRRKEDGGFRRQDNDDPRRRDDDDDDYPRGRRRDYGVEPHRGTMILIFGILGIVGVCPIFAPVAWAMGSSDLKAMAAGQMDREGEGMTKAGYILGMIGTILVLISLLMFCLIFGFAFFMAAGHARN